LEGFVARIDTPALRAISIEFHNQLTFEAQQLSQFIVRADKLHPSFSATVWLHKNHTGITFEYNYMRTQTQPSQCNFRMLCTGLDWQLSFLAEILGHLSPLLSSVNELHTYATYEEDVDPTQFPELFRPFAHVSTLRVSHQLVPGIVHALATEDMAAGVLPRLTSLTLSRYRDSSTTVVEAAEKFVAMRKLSGQEVSLFDV